MKRFANYQDVSEFLLNRLPMFSRQGPAALKPSLDNINQLLQSLGNPHLDYKVIHVAGTNGKGTVSHLLAGILQSQGFKVGLHTSPHYRDLRERMKVNGQMPPKDFVVEFTNEWYNLIEQIQPSFFEITVAMSFAYFSAIQVDYAVVEVGLGGRLDSTNVVNPLLSVITNISLDHTDLLGNTLQEIAAEKAGIIKPDKAVLIGERQIETTPVFEKIANGKNAPLYYADQICRVSVIDGDFLKTVFQVEIPRHKWKLEIDISGPFQELNLRTAFACVSVLEKSGIKWNVFQIKAFLKDFSKRISYMGRWQVLQSHPLILADSAHNAGGMLYILARLNEFPADKLHIILGFASDKKREEIFKQLPQKARFYFTQAAIPRALDAHILKKEAEAYGLLGNAYSSVAQAFDAAKSNSLIDEVIFIGGSIFVVAEIV